MGRKKDDVKKTDKAQKKEEPKKAEKPKRSRIQRGGKNDDGAKNAKMPRAAQKRPKTPERERRESIARDRKRAISRSGGVWGIAWLTALFELAALLLVAHKGGGTDMQMIGVMAAIVPAGLLTSLVLPKVLPMDALLMALTNFLCGVGVVILCTVTPVRGVRQAMVYLAGLAVMLFMSLLVSRIRKWKGLTMLAMLSGLVLLMLPTFFGTWSGGARNWISLPMIGSIQPSEFVKLALVLSLAYYFSAHRTVFQMIPALLFAGLCMLLLMMQRDLGTALIYYITTLALFFVASGNLPLSLLGAAGGVGAAALGYRMFAHVKVRVAMWKNPWVDPLDKGYQIVQALLAIGSGGLFGVGLGKGTPTKIPAYFNDFIFAVICEQLGLIFALLVMAVYVLLLLRGASIALRARRSFDMMLALGVVLLLGTQTVMIIGGVIRMIPLTGVTMPLLSYGGSSLISCMMMLGVLHGVAAAEQAQLEEEILAKKN